MCSQRNEEICPENVELDVWVEEGEGDGEEEREKERVE
jgi:hypothetical protein